MRFIITSKHVDFSERDYACLEKNALKITKLIPWKDPDYPRLEIIIKSHKKRNLNSNDKILIAENSSNKTRGHKAIDNSTFYEGTLNLILPQKRLIARMIGKTPCETLKDGFNELMREFDIYKAKYFKEDSEHFDRRTIRKTVS